MEEERVDVDQREPLGENLEPGWKNMHVDILENSLTLQRIRKIVPGAPSKNWVLISYDGPTAVVTHRSIHNHESRFKINTRSLVRSKKGGRKTRRGTSRRRVTRRRQ